MNPNKGSGYKSLTVPYGILQYAVRTGQFNEVQILLAMKGLFGEGVDQCKIREIAQTCKLHQRTVRKYVVELKSRNWIGEDPASGRLINRGWTFLRKAVNDKTSIGYLIPVRNLYQFKEFAIAASFDQLIRKQQYQYWLINRERNKKGTSQQTGLKSRGYYPIANKAYGKIFGISESTASRYRKYAVDAGYLEVQEDLTALVNGHKQLHHQLLKDATGEALVFRDKQYYIQGITHVRSKMNKKRICSTAGKNCKHYKREL